jgi:hypothetical protein
MPSHNDSGRCPAPSRQVYNGNYLPGVSAASPRRILFGGCVKRLFTALRAELYFVRHVIFTISLREIVKMTCLTQKYSAAAVAKAFLHNPKDYFSGQLPAK